MTHKSWKLWVEEEGTPLAVGDSDDNLICTLASNPETTGPLIAAAPDTLEALESFPHRADGDTEGQYIDRILDWAVDKRSPALKAARP